jgi:hypothetical protein
MKAEEKYRLCKFTSQNTRAHTHNLNMAVCLSEAFDLATEIHKSRLVLKSLVSAVFIS